MTHSIITTDQANLDLPAIVDDLNRLLRLRTTPIGMKMFKTRAEMEAIPRIRRPKDIHTTDQIVGQASRNGWTVVSPWMTWLAPSAAPCWACTRGMKNGSPETGCMVSGLAAPKAPPSTRPR